MIDIILIALCAYVYRLDGRNSINRAAYVAMMFLIGLAHSFNYTFACLFALVAIALKFMPTHPLFSAFTGLPYSRQDRKYIQWMQPTSITLARLVISDRTQNRSFWRAAGIAYGALRAIPAIAASFLMGNYTGLVFIFTGAIYYISGAVCKIIRRNNEIKGSIETVGAELAMGALLGMWMVTL